MNNKKCNGGKTDTPCPAALAKLDKLGPQAANWAGTITCPVCKTTWRGDYFARFPGDEGPPFQYKRQQ